MGQEIPYEEIRKLSPEQLKVFVDAGQIKIGDLEKKSGSKEPRKKRGRDVVDADVRKELDFIEGLMSFPSDGYQDMLQGLQKYFGGITEEFQKTGKSQVDMTTDITAGFFKFGELYNSRVEDLQALQKLTEYDRAAMTMMIGDKEVNVLQEYHKTTDDLYGAFRNFNKVIDEQSSIYGPAFSKMLDENAVRAAQTGLVMESYGVNASEMTKFLGREFDLTGEATGTMIEELITASQALEKQTGISAKLIGNEAVSIMNNVKRFGNVTVTEAARMSTAIKQVGITFSDLDNMVSKFEGFDSAASAVGDLTTVFGVQMDAMEMMMLANEDQEAFMHKMRDTFLDQGFAIEDMNRAQKNLLADTLNMDVRSIERFFGDATMSFEELQSATEDAKPEDMVMAFNQSLLDAAIAGKSLSDQLGSIINQSGVAVQNLAKPAFQIKQDVSGTFTQAGQAIQGYVTSASAGLQELAKAYDKYLKSPKDVDDKKILDAAYDEVYNRLKKSSQSLMSDFGKVFSESILASMAENGLAYAGLDDAKVEEFQQKVQAALTPQIERALKEFENSQVVKDILEATGEGSNPRRKTDETPPSPPTNTTPQAPTQITVNLVLDEPGLKVLGKKLITVNLDGEKIDTYSVEDGGQ